MLHVYLLELGEGSGPTTPLRQSIAGIASGFWARPANRWPLAVLKLNTRVSLDEAMSALSSEERARAAAIVHGATREAYVHAHALARIALAHRCGVQDPASLVFTPGASGKPMLAGHPDVHFSLSRRPGLAAVAIAGGPVGIDVERPDVSVDIEAIAADYFAAAEHRCLQSVIAAQRPVRFCEIWTRKEAVVKAAGSGLAAIKSFATLQSPVDAVDDAGVRRSFDLQTLAAGPDYVLSLAVQSDASLAGATGS